MSIASKLEEIFGVKNDIRDAIESFGYDLSDSPFTSYAEYICEIGEPTEIEITADIEDIGNIPDDLIQLTRVKTDIKNAIESKGFDLSEIPFTEYYEYIMQIPVGEMVTINGSALLGRGTVEGGGQYPIDDEFSLEYIWPQDVEYAPDRFNLDSWVEPYDPNYPLGYRINDWGDQNPLSEVAWRDMNIVALVSDNEYVHLDIFSNDPTLGTIEGAVSGDFVRDEEITLTAIPEEGAHFVYWATWDSFEESDELTISAWQDGYIEAIFASDQCNVTMMYDPSDPDYGNPDCGTVTGTGTYDYGDTATLTIEAEEGYLPYGMSIFPPNPYLNYGADLYWTPNAEIEVDVNSDLVVMPWFTDEAYVSGWIEEDGGTGTFELDNGEQFCAYPIGDTVTLTIIPDEGSAVGDIYLNDELVASGVTEYQFVPTVGGNDFHIYLIERPVLPLTFTSREDDSTIGWSSATYPDIEYSTDGGDTWETFTEPITVNEGEKVMFHGDNWSASASSSHFSTTGSFDLSDTLMSLVDSTLETTEMELLSEFRYLFTGCGIVDASNLVMADNTTYGCYQSMFSSCSSLEYAPELPAMEMSGMCYRNMFMNCTSLLEFPYDLPATQLADTCYANMFRNCTALETGPSIIAGEVMYRSCCSHMFDGCTSLVNAPELVAENDLNILSSTCYDSMFNGCTSLVSAPDLISEVAPIQGYANMFAGCTSLVNAPEISATMVGSEAMSHMFDGCTALETPPSILPAEDLAYADLVYELMFHNCTSLESAPELPATTLEDNCYSGMFQNCTSLVNMPELPATTAAHSCYEFMFDGCTALENVYDLPATTLANGCYYQMFRGCTSLETAPELPATALEPNCYYQMFKNCSSLNYIAAMFSTDPTSGQCTQDWVDGVAATGTFVKNGGATWTCVGVNGIPQGWTVEEVVGVSVVCDQTKGTVTGGGIYEIGDTATLTATATGVATFSNWTVNGVVVSTSNPYSFQVTGPVEVVGNFVLPTYTVTALSNISTMGTVTGGGTYTHGDTVTLTATAISPAEFENWTVNGSVVSTSNPYEFTATGNVTVTANFKKNLTFTSKANGSTIGWTSATYPNIEYSTDGTNWTAFTSPITVNEDDSVMFRNNGNGWVNSSGNSHFSTTGLFDIDGNILSLTTSTRVEFSMFTSLFRECGIVSAENLVLPNNAAGSCYASMFEGCTSLTTAPALPATTIYSWSYSSMFNGCTSLTTAPALPATTLSQYYCYSYMFSGCTSLVNAPSTLPATTLSQYCYKSMFEGCNSLVNAPALPATTLDVYCYNEMFNGCTALTSAPALPATTLAQGCYSSMFNGCTALTSAPALPATTIAQGCYHSMFNGCTSLTTAPALPATTLADSCYENMFYGCTALATAPALPATTIYSWSYSSMFNGCTSLTTAPALPATTLADYCYSSMFNGCTSLATAPALPATTLAQGCYKEMFRGCSSLVNAPSTLPATTIADYCYQSMFSGCYSLVNAPSTLPATTLAPYCYDSMFNGCAALTTAPALPATTLEEHCYQYMFWGCYALANAPALPATTIADYCYQSMFVNCDALTTAPALPATTLAVDCYASMFWGCDSLTTAPVLPATTLAVDCYASMFVGCTSLTTAPELLATTLEEHCYQYMFINCSNLSYVKCLATDISATDCTNYWLASVSSTGTFVKDASMTDWTTGDNGIPSGWTVQNA